MRADGKPDRPGTGYNPCFLPAVPATARSILEVGCAAGRLGALLKHQDPGRQVLGIARDRVLAERARQHLDQVFTLDVEQADPPPEPGSVDGISYADILEQLRAPRDVLRRHRRWLVPHGTLLSWG